MTSVFSCTGHPMVALVRTNPNRLRLCLNYNTNSAAYGMRSARESLRAEPYCGNGNACHSGNLDNIKMYAIMQTRIYLERQRVLTASSLSRNVICVSKASAKPRTILVFFHRSIARGCDTGEKRFPELRRLSTIRRHFRSPNRLCICNYF